MNSLKGNIIKNRTCNFLDVMINTNNLDPNKMQAYRSLTKIF